MVPLLVVVVILAFLALDGFVQLYQKHHAVVTKPKFNPATDAMYTPGFGLSMADGGAPIPEKEDTERKHQDQQK